MHIQQSGAYRSAMAAACLLVLSTAASCLLSPPIETRQEANLPPLIQPQSKNATISVTREKATSQVTVSAELFDPNEEPRLFYLFLSDEQGNLLTSQKLARAAVDDMLFYGSVSLTVDPCTSGVPVPGTEVITLYVSDRSFQTTSSNPDDIVIADGAFLVAYSWTLRYEDGICADS